MFLAGDALPGHRGGGPRNPDTVAARLLDGLAHQLARDLRATLLRVGQRSPHAAGQDLGRPEPRLVGHLRTLRHPVTQVHVRQTQRARPLDQPQDRPHPQRPRLQRRLEERVDRRQPVTQPIGQARPHQRVRRVPKLDDAGVDRGVLDHGAVVEEAHRRHVPLAVADPLVAAEQLELLGGGARRQFESGHPGVGPGNPAQGAARLEARHRDPDRHARLAAGTDRGVGDVVAAPEPGAGEAVVDAVGVGAGDLGDDLSLRPARDVGAGQRRRGVEEVRPAWRLEAHAAQMFPAPTFARPPRPVNAAFDAGTPAARTTVTPATRSCAARCRRVTSASSSQTAPSATVTANPTDQTNACAELGRPRSSSRTNCKPSIA